MTTFTRDDVIRMVQALYDLHGETARILNGHGRDASPTSQAAAELSDSQLSAQVRDAYIQANLLIEGAADHLIALTRVLTEPVQTIAPWTCVRAIIESGALALWLLDPILDARTRVQRSFAFRYEGLRQQAKIAQAAESEPQVDRANERIREVEHTAQRLGYPLVQDRRGRRIGIAQVMPPITEIIRDMLDMELVYRILSAAAHAHTSAYAQLGFRRVDGEGALLLEKSVEPSSAASLCIIAADVFARGVWLKCCLFGWDTEVLRFAIDTTFSVLGSQWREP